MAQDVPAIGRQLALEDDVGFVEQKEIVPAEDEGVVHVERDERHRDRYEAQPVDPEYAGERGVRPARLGGQRAPPIARMPRSAQSHVDHDEIVAPGPQIGGGTREPPGGAIEIFGFAHERWAPSGPQQRGAIRVLLLHIMEIADLQDLRRCRRDCARRTGGTAPRTHRALALGCGGAILTASRPTPSISASSSSPATVAPTPEGVPVKITSPAASATCCESLAMISGTLQIICSRSPSWRATPLTESRIRPLPGCPISAAGRRALDGADASKALPISHGRLTSRAAICRSRRVRSMPTA